MFYKSFFFGKIILEPQAVSLNFISLDSLTCAYSLTRFVTVDLNCLDTDIADKELWEEHFPQPSVSVGWGVGDKQSRVSGAFISELACNHIAFQDYITYRVLCSRHMAAM